MTQQKSAVRVEVESRSSRSKQVIESSALPLSLHVRSLLVLLVLISSRGFVLLATLMCPRPLVGMLQD